MNYDPEHQKLEAALSAGRYEDAVVELEKRSNLGVLDDHGALALGVMLMLPPCADFECAERVFMQLIYRSVSTEAAVWGAYLYTRCLPTHDYFVPVLAQCVRSAEALYMLAEYCDYIGNRSEAQHWITQAVTIRRFPNALLFMADHCDLTLAQRRQLINEAMQLVRDRAAEKAAVPLTLGEFLSCHWEELIVGSAKSSEVWGILESRARKSQ